MTPSKSKPLRATAEGGNVCKSESTSSRPRPQSNPSQSKAHNARKSAALQTQQHRRQDVSDGILTVIRPCACGEACAIGFFGVGEEHWRLLLLQGKSCVKGLPCGNEWAKSITSMQQSADARGRCG